MKSNAKTPAPDHTRPATPAEVQAAAADWLARRDAGLRPEEQARFYQWLAADPRHAPAWEEIEAMWRAFDRPRRLGDAAGMIGELATRRRRRRWRITIVSATAAATAMAAAWVFVLQPAGHGSPRPATAVARGGKAVLSKPERRVLADGSVVELNGPAAQIEVNFAANRRAVRLVRGEAHFEIAKDATRPFVVTAGAAEVRAVGTAFAVRVDAVSVDVLVTEGKVAVDRTVATPPPSVLVAAGNWVRAPEASSNADVLRVQPLPAAERERRLAWRAPRLELSDTPLAEVVALLNRENRVQLSVVGPELAGLRLSGVFRADNAEGFVHLLETHYGVRAERHGENAIALHRNDPVAR